MNRKIAAGTLFIVTAVLFAYVIIGVVAPKAKESIDKCTLHVTSIVVGEKIRSESDMDDGSKDVYLPIVEYEVAGKEYKITLGKSKSDHWEEGETIDIYVDPNDPIMYRSESATCTSVYVSLVFPVVFGLWGIIIVCLGIRERTKGKHCAER